MCFFTGTNSLKYWPGHGILTGYQSYVTLHIFYDVILLARAHIVIFFNNAALIFVNSLANHFPFYGVNVVHMAYYRDASIGRDEEGQSKVMEISKNIYRS